MNTMNLFESTARKIVCPLCDAAADTSCITRGRRTTREAHEARYQGALDYTAALAQMASTVSHAYLASLIATDDAAEGPEGEWFEGDYGSALAAVNGF